MLEEKRKRLAAKGWKSGSAAIFSACRPRRSAMWNCGCVCRRGCASAGSGGD